MELKWKKESVIADIKDNAVFVYSIKNLKQNDKVKFIREFFGYRLSKNEKRYSYGGLLEKLKGIKISDSIFFVPLKNKEIVKAYLESRKVEYIVKD